MQNNAELTVGIRLFSLICGVLYLSIITLVYGQLTGFSLWLSALVVLLGAAAIIASLALFCAKWVSQKENENWQVSLSTLLLLFIPFSIYLAWHSQMLQAIRKVVPRDDGFPWWLIHVYFIFFVVLTTIVLIRFGEALMWLVLIVRRNSADRRGSGHE